MHDDNGATSRRDAAGADDALGADYSICVSSVDTNRCMNAVTVRVASRNERIVASMI
jgi:hypothetical protein